ncbi:hypothetical protein MHW99_10815 [Corynebacterium sp. ACRPX]|uniref:hypothetical protein n=1 Tax=Corynebacterium sp. ACRPX TaxID=2918185 RepID=UPI001EF453E6|nr:hypothetical protein [Corynebacterium sp. ACRPX]MCG7246312.1 hypothetical protein [Corynebacterium sp. ACRPX]
MTATPTLTERIYNEISLHLLSIHMPELPALNDDNDPITVEHISRALEYLQDQANARGLDGIKEISHIMEQATQDHLATATTQTSTENEEQ